MKTLHHVLLGIALFFMYVYVAQQLYLFMFRDACQDAGGAYQAAYRLCTGLTTQEPDLGARMPYWRWLLILGIPAGLMVALQLSVQALVLLAGRGKPRSRGRRRIPNPPR